MLKNFLHIFFLLFSISAFTQQKKQGYVTVSGTVYDISARQPIEAVAVLSTMGNGSLTDSLGRYSITVRWTDSIWFSMLGKTTTKYAVDTIANTDAFNIMIHLRVGDLPEVKIRSKNYKFDSLENRREYAKIFNFKKPTLSLSTNRNYAPGGLSAGFDLESIINMFRFKRNRSLEIFQKRLLQQEQDKYIDYRFNKNLVRKLTKLQSPQIDSFMNEYRPDYEFLKTVNDIEFGYFVQQCFEQYKQKKLNKGSLRKNDDFLHKATN
ncbi:MAG: hypothetical protein ACOVO1_06705 [Chitinophagaceae bacterium]